MTSHLKLLALASAAMLTLPAAGHATVNLDIIESYSGTWTIEGTGFTDFIITPAGDSPTGYSSSAANPFSTGPFTASSPSSVIHLSGTGAVASGDSGATGNEYVVTSAPANAVVAELSFVTTVDANIATFNGTLSLGGALGTQSGPGNITTQGGSPLGFSLDGGGYLTGAFDASAVPEPASMALFGTGLLGLGAVLRRRKRSTVASALDTDAPDLSA